MTRGRLAAAVGLGAVLYTGALALVLTGNLGDRTTLVAMVVALSGGYSREEANSRLAANKGVVASFSRALTEGLSAKQSDDEFDAMLDGSVASIYEASIA